MIKSLKRLHKDEAGLKTLETVAILAVAAIILIAIRVFWKQIQSWAKGNVDSAVNDGEWKTN